MRSSCVGQDEKQLYRQDEMVNDYLRSSVSSLLFFFSFLLAQPANLGEFFRTI